MSTAQLPASFIAKTTQDPARKVSGAPTNFGREALPHIFSIAGRYSDPGHTYPWVDEATRDNRENAEMMRTECGIMECLEARQRGSALLRWHVEPFNSKDESAKDLAKKVTDELQLTWQFLELRRNLLEALWFGRYLTSHRFGITNIDGHQRQYIRKWSPRHGDKIVFRYDDGTGEFSDDQIGIRISRGYDSSETDWRGATNRKVQATQHGLVRWLDDWERQMVALHRHMIEDSSFHSTRDAGRVNGVGIRDRIYWTWYAMQECLGNLLTFIERSAYGIEIWKFPAGNPVAERRTIEAAKNRSHRSIIIVPVQPGEMADLQDVQIVEPGMAGAQAVIELIQGFFGHKIKRYILGQVLTTEAAATGLGSGVADAHMATYADIIVYDSTKLSETLTTDMVRPIQLANHPDSADVRLVFRIDTQAEDMDRKLNAWKNVWDMGGELPESDVMAMIGARIADVDEKTLKNPQFSEAYQQAMLKQKTDVANGAGGQWKPNTMKVFPPMGENGNGIPNGNEAIQQKYSATVEEIEAAARRTIKPSESQAEAGNYRKGKVRLHGLEISIETPKGESRKPEYPPLCAHYGYVKGTRGRDGDHVDVFIGPHPESELVVIVDQETAAGRFDEHKCMIGFTNMADAVECYRNCYGPGWRVGPATTLTVDQFKAWLEHGDQTQRVDGQVSRYARQKRMFGDEGGGSSGGSQQRFRWITIGGENEGGGTHVRIDTQNGDIVDGPSELADKGITNLKHFGETEDRDERSDAKQAEPSVRNEPAPEADQTLGASEADSRGSDSHIPTGSDAKVDDASTDKQPWQMTRGEWHAANRDQPSYDLAETNRQHKQAVADALRNGEDVPPSAYHDYSDLAELARQKHEEKLNGESESDQSPNDDSAPESSEPDPWDSPVENTPRDQAAIATDQSLADDSEYKFARKSTVSNVGEDVLGSARHKVNAWRGLDEAERDGTAAAQVTRDNLLKNEPHALMAHVAKNPLTALAMHFALRSFPPKPGYGRRYKPDDETAKKDRRQFVEAYQRIKTEAERLAATQNNPGEAIGNLQGFVSNMLREFRGQKSHDSLGRATASDPYNNTANALVSLANNLHPHSRKANSVIGQSARFAGAYKAKYAQDLSTENVAQHVSDIMEGRSLNETFDAKSEGGGKRPFSPADLYVNVAHRKGGKELPEKSPAKLAELVTGDMKMRAIQWGNSVSDDERKHHLAKATEAFVDLADVVGLPISAMSGEGTLALAIGARGTGRALAHYEPGKKIINLTRKNGVGSLAHEWGHFFDHWMGGLGISSDGSKSSGDYHSTQTSPKRFVKGEDGNWKLDDKGKMVVEDHSSKPMWKAFDDVRSAWKDSGYLARLKQSLNKAVEDGVLKRGSGGGTSFGATGYWTSNQEMFARTFERYVQHKLTSDSRENTYLSGYEPTTDKYGLWPNDDEAAKMAPVFDKLFETVRSEKYSHLKESSIQFENDFARSFNDAYEKITKGDQPPAAGYALPPSAEGKKAKEPTDAFHKAVVAAIGDDPEDVKGFKSLATEIWDRKRKEAEDNNFALRNLLSQFGLDGARQGAFIRQIQRSDDYDKIPRFDQMVEMAARDYPQLLEYGIGESDTVNDPEAALFARLHRGLAVAPAKHSDEVISEALDYVKSANRATSAVASHRGDWENMPFARTSSEWWGLVKYAASQWRQGRQP